MELELRADILSVLMRTAHIPVEVLVRLVAHPWRGRSVGGPPIRCDPRERWSARPFHKLAAARPRCPASPMASLRSTSLLTTRLAQRVAGARVARIAPQRLFSTSPVTVDDSETLHP